MAAASHAYITSHQTRYGMGEIKDGPCGRAGGGPGEVRYTYGPGETITIEFEEFIDHPGYFRIAFDEDGDDDLVDPADFYDYYTSDAVLLDNIPDKDGGSYVVEVTLPDVECENCTLQLAQIMTDKSPYGDGNDLYYSCVDLRLVEGGESTVTGELNETGESGEAGGQAESSGTGCSCRSAPAPASALALLPLLGLRRRYQR